jgi:hypothetical protein
MKIKGTDIIERNPEVLVSYIHSLHTTESYSFLNGCQDKLDCAPLYIYLQSLQDFQLKNVWNELVSRWVAFQRFHDSQNDTIYHKSIYSKQRYRRHHTHCHPARLNDLLTEFIHKDPLKEIFVIRTLVDNACPFLR